MAKHTALIEWSGNGSKFTDNRYSRAHRWTFDGGAVVPASSSPHVVRVPFSDPAGVDPEEAYIAALSSCHMLWFLSIAAEQGYVVTSYRDEAEGTMAKNDEGKEVVTRVVLKPAVAFAGAKPPSDEALAHLHHLAHDACFLANSVKTVIDVEGSWSFGQIL
ncbi:OsmC family protein [Paraburkholderia caribensis]|uniref:OsmC family protein n=1 Tax=Paraburkholderia caribensis TaxID=75105 RepID=A0A9Q6S4M8_9BURK|nr:OsmC family protein [Paraburkholderia caribensis]MCO4880852.1 OsmC family protein [Paraburkholderia caribensis]PTB25129.1 peroxiredoxin [Paraburkholderia caribensis]QLB64509.1 peroxiredoxin [Paraburkholderia caribensis]